MNKYASPGKEITGKGFYRESAALGPPIQNPSHIWTVAFVGNY